MTESDPYPHFAAIPDPETAEVNFVAGMVLGRLPEGVQQAMAEDNVNRVIQSAMDEPYRDSAGNFVGMVADYADQVRATYNPGTPPGAERLAMLEEVRRMEPLEMFDRHTSKRLGEQTRRLYASMPREYMHVDGLPYSTHNMRHFMSRYGRDHRPGVVVGVWKETPRLMMEEAARELEAKRALRHTLRMFLKRNGFLREPSIAP